MIRKLRGYRMNGEVATGRSNRMNRKGNGKKMGMVVGLATRWPVARD